MKPPIFLFGSGRCGTTLVQRVLNCHEDIVIWGEHEGFLGPLARSYRNLVQGPSINAHVYHPHAAKPEIVLGQLKDTKLDISWINDFTRDDVERRYRELITNLLCANLDLTRVHWGFKEIRYGKDHLVLWFLDALFPTARYVMMHRNPIDTTTSSILAWHKDLLNGVGDGAPLDSQIDTLMTDWYSKNLYLLNHSKAVPERCHRIRYETLLQDPRGEVQRLYDFLGLQAPDLAFTLLDSKVSDTSEDVGRDRLIEKITSAYQQAPAAFRALAEELDSSK